MKTVDLGARSGCQRYSQLYIARSLAGELAPPEQQQLQQHLEACLDCAAAAAELRSDQAAFRTAMPFERFAADFERRLEGQGGGALAREARARGRWLWPGFGIGLGAAAAAAALLLLVMPAEDSHLRSKGSESIGFLLQREDGVSRGYNGERLHQGDRIQFLVRAPTDSRAVVLLGVDGAGAVTVYHAADLREQAKGDEPLEPLPHSVILDATLGPERFFLVSSSDMDAAVLHDMAQRAAAELVRQNKDLAATQRLELPDPHIKQDSILINKVAR